MKKHISYPKVPQFRNIVTNINREVAFVGLDENGEAIYDQSIPKPILTFKGVTKIHGTNASVCYNNKEGLWAQSRSNIITIENDNFGFAFFVESNKVIFESILIGLAFKNNIDTEIYSISLYGEWAGQGVQKSVGISELQKAFYIFGAKVSKPGDEDFSSYWIGIEGVQDTDNKIFNLESFKTYEVEVDFNMPQLAQNRFVDITEEVEKECPVAKALGIEDGLGEGVVWSVEYKGVVHRFKVKGEKHSATKVKKLASVDTEKLSSIQEFVDYSVTENRFNQAIENVFGSEDLDVRKMGDFLRWIIADITSEEMDTLVDNGLEPKDVNKYISNKARKMFFTKQNSY